MRTAFHLTVSFGGQSHLAVTVPSTYAGALCGLCGNFDGDPLNDVPQAAPTVPPGCAEPRPRRCASRAVIGRKQRANGVECGLILLPEGPFQSCHPRVDPESYFQACITDYCVFRGHKAIVCQAVMGYAAACQEAGVALQPWRSKTFCGRWPSRVGQGSGRRKIPGFGARSKLDGVGKSLDGDVHQVGGQKGDGSILGGGKAWRRVSIPPGWSGKILGWGSPSKLGGNREMGASSKVENPSLGSSSDLSGVGKSSDGDLHPRWGSRGRWEHPWRGIIPVWGLHPTWLE